MSALTRWAAMGGYAVFVWPAYAFAATILGGLTVQSWRRHRASLRDLDRLQPARGPSATTTGR
jgi:heme exporter protein D